MGLTKEQIERIEVKGFSVTNVKDFLNLTPEDELIIEIRLALTALFVDRRKELGISQTTIAKRIGSSQSRIAKVENNDPSVSTDLLIKALAATGATIIDIVESMKPKENTNKLQYQSTYGSSYMVNESSPGRSFSASRRAKPLRKK